MKIGVVFPTNEIGADPAAIRDYAQAAESLGYDHLLAYDRVIMASSSSRDMFHEIFVLLGYLAAVTERMELVTGVLVLPQRQTALVAKQAAAVDVLSGGRLRLGVGVGKNMVEYEALGENFTNRGARSEEQIAVMRALWASELVTHEGKWHMITDAGLNPLPLARSIPIWIGGHADIVLRRVAKIGDGWMPVIPPDDHARAEVEKLRGYAREAGRDPAGIGIESWFTIRDRSPGDWLEWIGAWTDIGATHLSLSTHVSGFSSPDGHIDAIRRFREAYDGR
jgi:probable F420-dependent oxidoreductase